MKNQEWERQSSAKGNWPLRSGPEQNNLTFFWLFLLSLKTVSWLFLCLVWQHGSVHLKMTVASTGRGQFGGIKLREWSPARLWPLQLASLLTKTLVCLFLYVLKPGILMIVVMQLSEKDNTFAAIIKTVIREVFMEWHPWTCYSRHWECIWEQAISD